VSVKIGEVAMEIVHAQGRTIRTVRLFRPRPTMHSEQELP